MKNLTSLYEKHYKRTNALKEGSMPYSVQERKAFLEQVRGFDKMGQHVYRKGNLGEAIKHIGEIVELACQMNLAETQEWFDEITVRRHNKRLQEAYKIFEKTGKDMVALQQRMEACYEDIAEVLNKYYEVGSKDDEIL